MAYESLIELETVPQMLLVGSQRILLLRADWTKSFGPDRKDMPRHSPIHTS